MLSLFHRTGAVSYHGKTSAYFGYIAVAIVAVVEVLVVKSLHISVSQSVIQV